MREIGFLGRPPKLRANGHLCGLGSLSRKLGLSSLHMSNFDQLQCHADRPLTGFPLGALGPCLGPDIPLRAQPNHMVPTLADTEGCSLCPFRKGACSPKFDCMGCPGADERGSKAIVLPSTYLIFLFTFPSSALQSILGRFRVPYFLFRSQPPTTLVCFLSRTTLTPATLFLITAYSR
jgi:hypothetical protein